MADRDREFRDFSAARSSSLLRLAILLTGDHHLGEDLLQTTLVKVYLAWGRVREPAAAYAYSRRVMTTTYTSWWRRKSFAERPVGDRPLGDTHAPTAPQDAFRAVDDRDELRRLFTALTRMERAVLVLRLVEDLSVAETARELGIPAGTVKSHTSRALRRLRVLASDQDDPGGAARTSRPAMNGSQR